MTSCSSVSFFRPALRSSASKFQRSISNWKTIVFSISQSIYRDSKHSQDQVSRIDGGQVSYLCRFYIIEPNIIHPLRSLSQLYPHGHCCKLYPPSDFDFGDSSNLFHGQKQRAHCSILLLGRSLHVRYWLSYRSRCYHSKFIR